jgi:hypothetical protein
VNDVREREMPDERAVWRAEAIAVCAALVVLLVAFGGYLALTSLLPNGSDWFARAGSAVAGFWLATRAYRRVLRSQGFEPSGLGVPLRDGGSTTGP